MSSFRLGLSSPYSLDRFYRQDSGADADSIEVGIVIPLTIVILSLNHTGHSQNGSRSGWNCTKAHDNTCKSLRLHVLHVIISHIPTIDRLALRHCLHHAILLSDAKKAAPWKLE